MIQENNLLNNNLDGLSKHIGIYRNRILTLNEVNSYLEIGYLPVYIINNNIRYLLIIGSDITNEEFLSLENIEFNIQLLKQSMYWLEQAYNYLEWNKNNIIYEMIIKPY